MLTMEQAGWEGDSIYSELEGTSRDEGGIVREKVGSLLWPGDEREKLKIM